MEKIRQNNNKINNEEYEFDKLEQYLDTFANVFIGPEKETIDGVEIKNYSNEAKKVWRKMKDVEDKINKVKDKKQKELSEATKEMFKARQKAQQEFRKTHPNEDARPYVEKHPDVQKYRNKINSIQQEINNATKDVKKEFMEWKQKNIKCDIVMRNNNIVTEATAARSGLGYNGLNIEQASELNNVKLTNDKGRSVSGNLADIATSMIHLLTDKAKATQNYEEKSDLEKMVDIIIQAVQNFFGLNTNDGKEMQERKQVIEALLNQAVKECLKGNLEDIQKSIKNNKSMAQDKIDKLTNSRNNNERDTASVSTAGTDNMSHNGETISNNTDGMSSSTKSIINSANATKLSKEKSNYAKSSNDKLLKNALKENNKEASKEKEIPASKLKEKGEDYMNTEPEIYSGTDAIKNKKPSSIEKKWYIQDHGIAVDEGDKETTNKILKDKNIEEMDNANNKDNDLEEFEANIVFDDGDEENQDKKIHKLNPNMYSNYVKTSNNINKNNNNINNNNNNINKNNNNNINKNKNMKISINDGSQNSGIKPQLLNSGMQAQGGTKIGDGKSGL